MIQQQQQQQQTQSQSQLQAQLSQQQTPLQVSQSVQQTSYQDQQAQRQQQLQRLHQLQLQREQAQKQQLQQKLPTQQLQQQQQIIVRSPAPISVSPSTTGPPSSDTNGRPTHQQVVVNPKTKTALANMLSVRLQNVSSPSSGPRTDGGGGGSGSGGGHSTEPSAAGALRLMTAQHNASLNSAVASPRGNVVPLQQQRHAGPYVAVAEHHAAVQDVAKNSGQPYLHQHPTLNDPKKTITSVTSGMPNRIILQRPPLFYGHNPNLKCKYCLNTKPAAYYGFDAQHSKDWVCLKLSQKVN